MKIHDIEITHPEKVMFPAAHITKLDIVKYYRDHSDKILPFLKDRPLTIQRFPEGISKPGFYQKKAGDYFPSFVKTVRIPTQEGSNNQVYCNTKKSLIYLVNQGTVSFHIWPAKRDQLKKPDKVIFDLDPSDHAFSKVKEAAALVAEYLKEKNHQPKVMTTGQTGLHLWYTIRRSQEFDPVREKIKSMAEELTSGYPQLFTTEMRKKDRGHKIFLDYLRNSYGQTSICPYSLRPNPVAGIAMPIQWNDLKNLHSADQFNLKNEFIFGQNA